MDWGTKKYFDSLFEESYLNGKKNYFEYKKSAFQRLRLSTFDGVIRKVPRLVDSVECYVDIGCATGELTEIIRSSVVPSRTIGLDFSEVAIAVAQSQYPHIEFQNKPGSYIEKYEALDLVTINEVLYYLNKKESGSLLSLVFKSLSRNGYLVVSSRITGHPYANLDELLKIISEQNFLIERKVFYYYNLNLFVTKKAASLTRLLLRINSSFLIKANSFLTGFLMEQLLLHKVLALAGQFFQRPTHIILVLRKHNGN